MTYRDQFKSSSSQPKFMKTFSNHDWQLIQEEVCFQGFFKLVRFHFKHRKFAGGMSEVIRRETFVRGDATCVLLYDPSAEAVVLVEQFRVGGVLHGGSPWMFELVAGINEDGETTENVARREAVEEAGAEVLDLWHIQDYYPSPGGSTERISLYLGLVDSARLGGIHGLEEEGEDIKVHVLPLTEAVQHLEEGLIDNSPAIIALQWLLLHRARIDQQWHSAPEGMVGTE